MSSENFANDFHAILRLAESFSKDGTDNPYMEQREIHLKKLSHRLVGLLHEDQLDAGVPQTRGVKGIM